jgi:hypothetical protein
MNEAVRRTLYANQGVKMLLRHMLKERQELLPEYDQNAGFRYPLAEQFILGPMTEALYLIRKLYEAGILLKKYRDKAVACPSCLSPAVSVKYLCVACSSSNFDKTRILEHVRCGFSDTDEMFMKEGEWSCPRCSKAIQKEDLREIEATFCCKDCGKSFEKPTWMHSCKKCRLNFTLNEASFIDVYAYVLSHEIEDELEIGAMSITPISGAFEKYGFRTAAPGYLKGKTGSVHPFDLMGKVKIDGKDATVVVDVAYSTETVDVTPVTTLMGKLIDTEVELGLLVAIPSLDQTARNLAELYDIEVIEARTSKEAAEAIPKKLKKVFTRTSAA